MNDLYVLQNIEPSATSWPDAHWQAVPGIRRAPQAPDTSETTGTPQTVSVTPTATGHPTTTKDRPYFPDPSSVTPVATASADSGNNDSSSGSLAKAVLEYAILVVVLVVLGCGILYRISRLRRANQPPSAFFSLSTFRSRDQNLPCYRPNYPRTHGLPRVGPAYPPLSHSHPTRSNDIDAFGRRLGPGGFDDKDQLPPYEPNGGPPKYFELNRNGTRNLASNQSLSGAVGTGPPSAPAVHDNHAGVGEERENNSRSSPADDDQAQHADRSPPGLNPPSSRTDQAQTTITDSESTERTRS